MKTSEKYHLAQIAVVTSNCITPENKLEVLHELIDREEFELYCEEKKEQEGNTDGKSL